MEKSKPVRYILLYIPFFLSIIFSNQVHFSYIVAWLGSFYIFYLSYKSIIKPLPNDLPIEEQLLRPIFLLQIIFAGYMACTSIFYYFNALGYEYLNFVGSRFFMNDDVYKSIRDCQQYYVLAHAAFVNGILANMKYPIKQKYALEINSMSNTLLAISIVCLPLGFIFSKIGGLSQFSVQLSGLSFVSGTIALAFSIREHRKINIWLAAGLFIVNLYAALNSGFKEPIIISVLLLGVFLLPVYGKKVVPIFGSLLLALFFILPTFISNFRAVIGQGLSAEEARVQSITKIIENKNLVESLSDDNWAFLTLRLSEIDMFIKFTQSTPRYLPYYKLKLVEQSFEAVIPRILWPQKPSLENLVMDRVYRAGVINIGSNVSAKPAYVVDCFLSYGKIGIIIGLFFYGYIAQWISNKAEFLFGGYFMGSAVMFAGLFQIFWRGNSFEIMLSAVFWSFITMFIIFKIFKAKSLIVEI